MTRTSRYIILSAAALGLALTGAARAEITEFAAPAYKGHLLDWCFNWAADCGKKPADAWCKLQGYDGVEAFKKWENPNKSTRLIGSNQVCDEPECDSYTKIACFKDDGGEEEVTTYKKPKYKGRRLDWCLSWAADCGKPAAQAYCEWKGDTEVVDFKIAENIGNTKIISSGQNCDMNDCDGFSYITCK
jgi:hypothetical protein